jgi:branched-chain amino acid transport system substrate-binding protein
MKLFMLVTATFLSLMAADFAQAESCPPKCPSGKIPLGIILPTSGPPAAFGRQALKPAEIAVNAINASGGLMGTPIALSIADDRCDAGLALEAAKRQIASEKISAVIGPICPAAADMAAPSYSEAGIIEFLPTVSTKGFGRQKLDKLFRLIATDEQEARALADYIGRARSDTKLTVIYTDAFYRRPMMEVVRMTLPADIKAHVQFEPIMDTGGAYDRLIDRLRRNPPDAIYLALDNAMLPEFLAKLRSRGPRSYLIGGQRLYSQSFLTKIGEAAKGIDVLAPIASLVDPELLKVVELLNGAGTVPDLVSLNTYAAIQIWAMAVQRAGTGETMAVLNKLRSDEFQTVVGSVAFEPNGNRRSPQFSVLTWQNGWLKQSEATR